MFDPVSGYEYPVTWEQACASPDDLALVRSGLAILTADGSVLKRGFTTGTTAAAAAKASVLSLKSPVSGNVTILTPAGVRVTTQVSAENGHGTCSKYSGDYPGDVTAGIRFHAEATREDAGILITTGPGIGIWERSNPRYPRGTPAISPPALDEIRNAIAEALSETGLSGVRVSLSAEDGELIASKTLNAKIGVMGGISVLGSTGFVEPWDDHLEESCLHRIALADKVVLTTGRVGLRHSRLLFPDHEVILVGSRLRPALEMARGAVIICGLPALILKYINPEFLEGTGYGSIEEMIGTETFDHLARGTLAGFCARQPAVRVVLLNRAGKAILEAP